MKSIGEQNLQHHVAAALEAVKSHPGGVLLPGFREAVYAALGPFVFDVNGPGNYGYRRRAKLALLCAMKVRSFSEWSIFDNGLGVIPEFLDSALNSIDNGKPVSLPDLSVHWDVLEDVAENISDSSSYAIITCLNALNVCRVDEGLIPMYHSTTKRRIRTIQCRGILSLQQVRHMRNFF